MVFARLRLAAAKLAGALRGGRVFYRARGGPARATAAGARRARPPRGARGGERRERDVGGDRGGLSAPARRPGAERRAPPGSARRRRRAALARARADRPRRLHRARARSDRALPARERSRRADPDPRHDQGRAAARRRRSARRATDRAPHRGGRRRARGAVLAARRSRGNRRRRQPLLPLDPAVRRVAQPPPGCAAALSRGAHRPAIRMRRIRRRACRATSPRCSRTRWHPTPAAPG